MSTEQTLILVKPDGVAAGHIGDVISRLEGKGYVIAGLKVVAKATDAQLRQHYADKVAKAYFPELVAYMQSGSLVAIIAEGVNVVAAFRQLAGVTNPDEAVPGSIRGDYGRSWSDGAIRNVVHSSDSPEAAKHEMQIWFPELNS